MKDPLKHLQDHSKETVLNEDERMSLRRSLMEHIDKNPIKVPDPKKKVVSPWISKFSLLALSALALFIVVGGSISMAAEGTLPGDTLYPVKRMVNEQVKGFFTFSSESKAEFEATLAARRLEEAERLENDAQLSEETHLELKHDFEKHMNQFSAQVKVLQENKAEEGVSKVQKHLETSVQNHKKMWKKFAENNAKIDSAFSTTVIATSTHATSTVNASTTSQSEKKKPEVKVDINSTIHVDVPGVDIKIR